MTAIVDKKREFFKELMHSLNLLNSKYLKATKKFKKNDGNVMPFYDGYIKDIFSSSDTYFYYGDTKNYYPNEFLVLIDFFNKTNDIFSNNVISLFLMNDKYVEEQTEISLNDFVKRCNYFFYILDVLKKNGVISKSKPIYKGDLFVYFFFKTNIKDLESVYNDFVNNKDDIISFYEKKMIFIDKRKNLNNLYKGSKGRIKGLKNNKNKNNNINQSEINDNLRKIRELEKEISRLKSKNFELSNKEIIKSEKVMADAKAEIQALRTEFRKEMFIFNKFSKNETNQYLISLLTDIQN